MYFNNIFISFIILFWAHIKILINLDPSNNLLRFVVDNDQYIIKHNHSDRQLFILIDKKHLELLQQLSFLRKYRPGLSAILLLILVQLIPLAYLINIFINWSQHCYALHLSLFQFFEIRMTRVCVFQQLFYYQFVFGYPKSGLFQLIGGYFLLLL